MDNQFVSKPQVGKTNGVQHLSTEEVNNWNTIEGGSEKKSVGGESNWKAGKVKEGKKTFCDNAR